MSYQPGDSPNPKAGFSPGDHLLGAIYGSLTGLTDIWGSLKKGFNDGYTAFDPEAFEQQGVNSWHDTRNLLMAFGGFFLYGAASIITAPFNSLYGAVKGLTGGFSAAHQFHKDNLKNGGWGEKLVKAAGTGLLVLGAGIGKGLFTLGKGLLKLAVSRPLAAGFGLVTGLLRGAIAGPWKVLKQSVKNAWNSEPKYDHWLDRLMFGAKFAAKCVGHGLIGAVNIGLNFLLPIQIGGEPGPYRQAAKGFAFGVINGLEGGKGVSFKTSMKEVFSGRAGDGVTQDHVGKQQSISAETVTGTVPERAARVSEPAEALQSRQQQLSTAAASQTLHGGAQAAQKTSYTPSLAQTVQTQRSEASTLQTLLNAPLPARAQEPQVKTDLQKTYGTQVTESSLIGGNPIGAMNHLKTMNILTNETFTLKIKLKAGETHDAAIARVNALLAREQAQNRSTMDSISNVEILDQKGVQQIKIPVKDGKIEKPTVAEPPLSPGRSRGPGLN